LQLDEDEFIVQTTAMPAPLGFLRGSAHASPVRTYEGHASELTPRINGGTHVAVCGGHARVERKVSMLTRWTEWNSWTTPRGCGSSS
jgi:hypothetical protein